LTVGAQGFARVDFFIEESTGRILLNEINTIPGFTSISMFGKMCEAGGLQYKEVLDRVILLGKEIHRVKSKLKRIPDEIASKIQ
ncbi:MAG: D-alanine--D-alanine ligase A, partial [Spirochaetes bacterium]